MHRAEPDQKPVSRTPTGVRALSPLPVVPRYGSNCIAKEERELPPSPSFGRDDLDCLLQGSSVGWVLVLDVGNIKFAMDLMLFALKIKSVQDNHEALHSHFLPALLPSSLLPLTST